MSAPMVRATSARVKEPMRVMHPRILKTVAACSVTLLVTLLAPPHAEAAVTITVPATATIGSTLPTFCSTTSTTITVTSSKKNYDLRIRSNTTNNPNGKAKNGSGTEMLNSFQYATAAGGPFTNVTASYVNVFSNQPTGSNVNHIVYYRQCVDWGDDAGNFTIGVDYLVAEL
ncbi:MAG: hypothetical protein DMF98_18760 [Acidobacteria bacterium]|nr:MAG: hypothetical protein DMF98_18760 [Acidobacteriota bacterium]